jgi:hypothetical protein
MEASSSQFLRDLRVAESFEFEGADSLRREELEGMF